MKTYSLEDMTKGWFVGDFDPTALKTPHCEVGCKRYSAGDCEDRHVHRVATEVTVILSGHARMNGRDCPAGTVVVLDPGEASDFAVSEDTITVVVKTPSIPGDKYPAELPGT